MHSYSGSSSLSSTECSTIISDGRPSSSIDILVGRFLDKCLVDEDDFSSISWGEASGLPVNNLQTLSRSFDNSVFSEDKEHDHKRQAGDLYATSFLPSFEQYQNYAQALALATSRERSLEYPQPFASQFGNDVNDKYSSYRVDGLALILDCSDAETLKQTTDEVCPICLEGLKRLQKVQKLPCSHKLHVRCCKRFFRTVGVKPLCPCCRFDMTPLSQYQTQHKGMTC